MAKMAHLPGNSFLLDLDMVKSYYVFWSSQINDVLV